MTAEIDVSDPETPVEDILGELDRMRISMATDGMHEYVVFVSPADDQPGWHRHPVHATSAENAAKRTVESCTLTHYKREMVLEVFVHKGTEFRYAYQLTRTK
jgi:hypothetical protein